MSKVNLGPVSAYADAVKQGYTGTREQFGKDQADFAKNAAQVAGNLEESKKVLSSVEEAGNTQKTAIATAGAAERAAINTAAEAKTAEASERIEAKGAEVLGTIPPDYTETVERVNQLSEEIADQQEEIGGIKSNLNRTVSGRESCLTLANVSPVAHSVKVKVESKNLIPYPYMDTTKTVSGITFTDNGDGSITVNGTATGNAFFFLCEKDFGDINMSWDGATRNGYVISGYAGDKTNGVSVVYDTEYNKRTYLRVYPNAVVDNVTVYPQMERGTVATEYHQPNANVAVSSCGKNLITYPYMATTKTV
jgi:hypothetical protein